MASSISDTPSSPVVNAGGVSISIDDTTVFKDIAIGPTTRKAMHMLNGSGASAAYVHVWDNISPALGTTAQSDQFLLATSERLTVIEMEDHPFENGMSVAATSDKGTAANTNPASAVTIKLGIT